MNIDRFCRQGSSSNVVKRKCEFHDRSKNRCVERQGKNKGGLRIQNCVFPPLLRLALVGAVGLFSGMSVLAETPRGDAVLNQVLQRLTLGPAFNAKIRKRVWTSGREVRGVGSYEQAGQSTGNYNMQLTMLDGEGKHSLQQISDGRLAWTRTEIAGSVLLRRVDVRILEQRIRESGKTPRLPPRVLVGGLAELIDSIRRDYDLRLKDGTFQLRNPSPQSTQVKQDTLAAADGSNEQAQQKFLVVSGNLKPAVREKILEVSGRSDWPSLCPTQVQVLITTSPDPEFGFGEGLPRRIYFFSDPIPTSSQESAEDGDSPPAPKTSVGPLISLMELYSVQPIATPSPSRFTFENRDEDNSYINETDRYLERYGMSNTP